MLGCLGKPDCLFWLLTLLPIAGTDGTNTGLTLQLEAGLASSSEQPFVPKLCVLLPVAHSMHASCDDKVH